MCELWIHILYLLVDAFIIDLDLSMGYVTKREIEYHQHFILSSFRMKKLNADANLSLTQTNVLLCQTNMEFTFVHCSFFDNMFNFVEL